MFLSLVKGRKRHGVFFLFCLFRYEDDGRVLVPVAELRPMKDVEGIP